MAFPWEVIIGSATTVLGAAGAWFAGVRQRRAERAERREDRREERAQADRDRVRALYIRLLAMAREYKDFEANPKDRWASLSPRLFELQAELEVVGSDAVRVAFREYIKFVQLAQWEADQYQLTDEFIEHYDSQIDQLSEAMRLETRPISLELGVSAPAKQIAAPEGPSLPKLLENE